MLKLKEANVKGPSKNPVNVYAATKGRIEDKGESMKEGYEGHRQMVDLQKEAYEENMDNPLVKLPQLEKFQQLNKELGELFKKQVELKNEIKEEEYALFRRDMPFIESTFNISRDEIMELIKDENKLKAYEQEVRNSPPYRRLVPDPNILWGFRERWLHIQELKQQLQDVNSQIEATMKEFEKLKDLKVAQDLQGGNYEVMYRDDKGPGKHPKIETPTEQQIQQTEEAIEKFKEETRTPEQEREEMKKELKEMRDRDLRAFKDLFG
ncbi:MAG: hypothetical protein Q9N34_06725 [Aquificota bacterium]|nr:hypothetical protein [Aquificota bacterium]